MKKNILVCVSGLTPQIVSETLYCLSIQRKIKIDELYIITTVKGRDIVLGKDKEYNKGYKNIRQYPPLKSELERLCKKYKIKKPFFEEIGKYIIVAKEQSVELYDIKDDRHNQLFPNRVCEVINEKTLDDNNILYCSISGGRKTMSVDIAYALSLFGRENDRLFHVLTNGKFEFKHFFPENKDEDEMLILAEIPYIRLRPLIADFTKNKIFKNLSYTDLVELTQIQLRIKTSDKLYIDWRRKEIWFGDNQPLKIPPSLLTIYRYLYTSKKGGKNSEDIKGLSKYFYNTYETKNTLSRISKLNDKIAEAVIDEAVSKIFEVNGPKEFGYGQYGILADTDKIVFID